MRLASDYASQLVGEYERAILTAGHLSRAYETARLVPGTNTALTELFNLMEDAQAKRERAKRRLIEALASEGKSN